MKTDLLACRHIGVNKADAEVMLRKIGVASLDELIDKTIPANIRLKAPLALPAPMTEYEFARHIAELAGKNKLFTTYIGMGWYNTITPAVIQRNVFENPVWYTSYTPYQTEVSQGRLEALMNFQTAVCANAIGLKNVTFRHARAEEEKQTFDFVVSRAVMPLADLIKIIRKNISPKQQNALPNGLICLKGGELEHEAMPFKHKTSMHNLNEDFDEEFFQTKKVVYVTI